MTDLKNGIIEIEGMTLSRNTNANDFSNISNPNINVTISKRGHTYVKFKNPIIANGVSMFVNVACYADSDVPEIELCPSIPIELQGINTDVPKYKVKMAKLWLKEMISIEPTTDCSEGISYHFKNCHISAFMQKDPHYGLLGGEITLYFDDEG